MGKLVVDATLHEKLQQAADALELVSPDGRTLGYFMPAELSAEWLQPTISEEELDRREKEVREKGGRTLSEIMADLEKRA